MDDATVGRGRDNQGWLLFVGAENLEQVLAPQTKIQTL